MERLSKISVVDRKLLDVHKLVETCRRELHSVRGELASVQTEVSERHNQSVEAYQSLYWQHEETLKEMAAIVNTNLMLKNNLEAAQSKTIAQEQTVKDYENRVRELERENRELKNAFGGAPELVLHLEEHNRKEKEMLDNDPLDSHSGVSSKGPAKTGDRKRRRRSSDTISEVPKPIRKTRKA
jgi:uncharacterized protein YukE